jgi:hypothetical protein
MKILTVAIGGFADADATRLPEYPLYFGNEPLCLVDILVIAELAIQRNEQDQPEGVRPKIPETIRPNPLLAHPSMLLQDESEVL